MRSQGINNTTYYDERTMPTQGSHVPETHPAKFCLVNIPHVLRVPKLGRVLLEQLLH